MKPPRGANGNKLKEGSNTGRQQHSKLMQSQEGDKSKKVECMINVGTLGTVCDQDYALRVPKSKRGKCYNKYKKNYKTKYVESK